MSGQSLTLAALFVVAYAGVWIWICVQQKCAIDERVQQGERDAQLWRNVDVLSTVRWKRGHEAYLERGRRPRRSSRRPLRRVR